MLEQQPFADVSLASNPEPRCPCVLLLDVSGSMAEIVADEGQVVGESIQKDRNARQVSSGGNTKIALLNNGLKAYQSDLLRDSLAAQRVEVSIITFGGNVQTVIPFTAANEFDPPTLTAKGDTPMGAAIMQAIKCIEDRKQVYKQNGIHYFRPWIFLITDGVPTDALAQASEKIKEGERNKAFAFFAVSVEEANLNVLNQVSTRVPLLLKNYSFREMFIWLSQSQKSVSQSNPGQESQIKLVAPTGWASL